MSGIAQREAPHVGIFWVVQTPEAEPRLLAAGCPLDQAEPYGDCLTYGPGHYETWAHWRRDRTGRSLRIAAHHRSTCGAPSVRGGAIVATERRHNAVTRGGVKPGHFRGRPFRSLIRRGMAGENLARTSIPSISSAMWPSIAHR